MSAVPQDAAYVTMTSRKYIPLTAVLIRSLVATGTRAAIVMMALPDVLPEQVAALKRICPGLVSIPVKPLPLPPQCRIFYGNWRTAMQKIQVWRLEQYRRLVYLDSDMLVLTNVDELLGMEELHAVPTRTPLAPGMEIINSGMIVTEPAEATFQRLYKTLAYPSLFDTPEHGRVWFLTDQELINAHYSDHETCIRWREGLGLERQSPRPWKRLPYYYNAVIGDRARLAETWRDDELRIVHFTDCIRPWQGGTTALDANWMSVFRELVGKNLIVP